MISGLNHLTIAVSDINRSICFYPDVLGLSAHVKWDSGAYLSAGDLWFCLSLDSPCPKEDYTHIAFNVSASSFETISNRIESDDVAIWKDNSSEGLSLYILDPDGHKLELHVGSLESRLEALKEKPYSGLKWL